MEDCNVPSPIVIFRFRDNIISPAIKHYGWAEEANESYINCRCTLKLEITIE